MPALTVSQLNFYVKTILESDSRLKTVYLKGEISNLTDHYRSGHIYLTLKDEKCAIKAVMFSGSAKYLKFKPEDGMKVIVRGRVSLYDVSGAYQFYIDDMQPDGVGALNLAFEQLKKKLSAEGLFAEEHKQPLPSFPKRIGVITSPTGAAVQDICRILKRRYPIGEIVMCPVLVQGEGAALQLTEAVRKMNDLQCADVIIIGRGGGSIEDLWAFNDETLARTIYQSAIPIVSAVGHETDYTICDFVADVRASTPSAGAELVSPEMESLQTAVLYYRNQIQIKMQQRLDNEKSRLNALARSKVLSSPMEQINTRRMKLDFLSQSVKYAYGTRLSTEKKHFAELNSKLDTLSPLKVLGRGYAMVSKDNKIVRSVAAVNNGDELNLMMSDGTVRCTVTERSQHEKDF